MSIMKKMLRGTYYFCAGIKASFSDLCDRCGSGKRGHVRASLISAVFVITVSSVGAASLLTACSGRQAAEPAASSEASVSEPAETPSDASQEASGEAEESSSSEAASEPEVDAMATATRFEPISAESLISALTERAKAYYENPTFIPPAAGDIAGWKKINPDTIGWISIANTNINYPVLKGPYTDYYTHRGYYKESSRNGVIWVDTDTQLAANGEITSTNTVVYGHNWTNCWRPVRIGNPNDIMLAQLAAYDDASFAKSNPYIRLATADGDHMYQVFAVFYTDLSFSNLYYAELPNNGLQKVVDTAKKKSIHKFDVPVNAKTDKFITLSTCTRVLGAGDNQRFIVMAKKIS